MTRREFTKKSSIAAPYLMLLPSLLNSCKKDLINIDVKFNGRVLVIGAGIAGLHAAMLLRHYGCEVLHLEASERAGGRILSQTGFTNFPVELGAEAVHGSRNILFDLATAKGFQLAPSDKNNYYRLYNQTRKEADIEDNPNFAFLNQIIESFGAYQENDANMADYLDRLALDPFIKNIAEALIGNEYGTNNTRLSIKAVAVDDAQWTTGNTDYFFKNESFGALLQEAYSNEISKVEFNKVVAAINYGDNNVNVITDQGESYLADKVLLTVPISILKAGDISFMPPLPQAKLDALNSMEMDTGMKVIMKFSERFWPEDMGNLIGGAIAPEYWITGAIREGNDHLLTAFVMGEKAEQLAAMGNDAINALTAELNQYFNTQLASQSLQNFIIKNWKDEIHIRGAYSYTKSGSENQRREYARAIDNKCFFAGEAANFSGHPATVHGAMETAFDNAKLILENA
jgi:monoamine oxidase